MSSTPHSETGKVNGLCLTNVKEGSLRSAEPCTKKIAQLFEKAVTLRKLIIFSRDFFKTTSTLSETHESGDFQDNLALSGEVYSKIVTQQTHNFNS